MKPCAIIALLCLSIRYTLGQDSTNYFPLEKGNSWTYRTADVADIPPAEVPWASYWQIQVASQSVDKTALRYVLYRGEEVQCFVDVGVQETADGVDIDLPEEGFVPFYRFSLGHFIHRDFDLNIPNCEANRVVAGGCNDGRTVQVSLLEAPVETRVGMFSGCLLLEYKKSSCADAGRLSETWCPEVGLVRWADTFNGGIDEWRITAFSRPSQVQKGFRRADTTSDSLRDISDAVSVLLYLFSGGFPMQCPDAADIDDNGVIEITDPIALLGQLFLGHPDQIPGPFPECGGDLTEDDLGACEYHACQ